MKPLVSVIIPALNEEKNLGRCLAAVFSQKTDFEFEALVVDSGSKDRTQQVAQEFAQKHPLKILEVAPARFSHGRTRQFASEQAQGDYLVYLVADAEPANDRWLAGLVNAAKDETVAGAYSRQQARPGASVMEKVRLSRRTVSKSEPRVSEISRSQDYWMMEPVQRIFVCDFDDVSSLRKRSALEKIPIPDCAWAEDLLWSKACLLAGYKIAFAPESVVRHSHRLSTGYLFRRGWIDQKAAAEHFGMVYYPEFANALRGFFIAAKNEIAEIMDAKASFAARLDSAIRAPALIGSEIAGRYLARAPCAPEKRVELVAKLSAAKVQPRNAGERVARTGFVVGDQWRKAILANPPAVIDFAVDAGQDARFRFGIGIKPEAFKHRTAPIDFTVAVNDESVFKARLEMRPEMLKGWKDFEIELAKWGNNRIKLSLITDSQDMNCGWAAWAEPIIVFPKQKPRFALKRLLAKFAEKTISGNFRHN